MAGKRRRSSTGEGDEEVEKDLRSLAAEQESAREQQRTRQRRYQYAPMTQIDDIGANSQQAAQDPAVEAIPSGYIKKISLRNFMCHENFELELGPRLNFIVGNNGSGKSAILTAITIGLGAKASDTQRGSSLKSLIREGSHQAKISLCFENGRHGAYDPETFGNTIVIQRTIKADGSSVFSLQSGAGREISSKKRDIQAVMDYFSLPINNPMCFLSQDAARSFLTASTSHDKYVLFMKATLLQDVSDSLDKAREINHRAKSSMGLHLRNLKELKEEYEESKRLLQEFNKATDLNHRKRLLQGKSMWIDVGQNTEAKNKLKAEVEAHEQRIRRCQEKVKSKSDRVERFMVDKEAQNGAIDIKIAELSEKMASHQQANVDLQAAETKYNIARDKNESLKTAMRECRQKAKSLDLVIDRIKRELRDEIGGDREQMENEIVKTEAQNEEIRGKLSSNNEEIQQFKGQERALIDRRRVDVDDKERSIQSKQDELRHITRENSDLLSNFDRQMTTLLRMIQERSHEFDVPPVGPLGVHLTVKKGFESWTRAIQRQLSPWLSNFLVGSQKDSQLLRQIIRSCNMRTNISITNYSLGKSFSYRRAQSQYPSIADALEFSSTDIKLFFIDLAYVANIVLIEDRNEARKFLIRRPQDVRMALALRDPASGYQIIGGRRIDTVTYQSRLLLKVQSSTNSDHQYLEGLIQQEKVDLQKLKERYSADLEEIRSRLRSAGSHRKILQVEITRNDSKIETLRKKLSRVVDTGSLEANIDERKRTQEIIETYEATATDLASTIKEIEKEISPLKDKYDRTRVICKEAQQEIYDLKAAVQSRSAKIQKWKDEITDLQQEIHKSRNTIQSKTNNVKMLEEGIKDQAANASEFCSKEQADGADLPNNQEEIKLELDRVSQMILRAEKRVGISQEKAVELFEECRSKYKEGQERYHEINQTLEMLSNSIQVRVVNFQSAQRTTCLDADLDFRASLRVRRLSGNLSFINTTKQLEIFILTPNDESARNVDNLSGGEKSFAQMALLLATWKPMRSRVIALDEFDVFMDQVNRKIGTNLILKKLKDNARTQTIIITPQDIGKIADLDSNGVAIHRMRDPQRQTNSSL